MKSPPAGVKLVMAAVCVMRDIKPDKINDPAGTGQKILDYWGPSKRLLGDLHFIDYLKDYDKDNIPVGGSACWCQFRATSSCMDVCNSNSYQNGT